MENRTWRLYDILGRNYRAPHSDANQKHLGSRVQVTNRDSFWPIFPRDKGCMRFVKFVTSEAPAPRFDFHMSYIPVVDSQESSEDEEFKSGESSSEGFFAELVEEDDDEGEEEQ